MARRAVSTAVKAESTAAIRKEAREKRNERTRTDAEIRQAEDRFDEAQNQIAELKAELASETRNRELAERDAINYSNQLKELRKENGDLREELARLKVDNEATKSRLASSRMYPGNKKQTVYQPRTDPFLCCSVRRPYTLQVSPRSAVYRPL
jgi:small-conductance mechanosensitive channel